MFPALAADGGCHVPMDEPPVPTTLEQQHSWLQTPKAGKHYPSEQGVTRGFHPTSPPWKSRLAPMQAGTSRRSTAGGGSLHSSSRSPCPGVPPFVPIVPSSPQPSPQPEEAEHLREVLRRRLARRRSVRTPAGVEAGLARSPGPGPAHTPSRFLKYGHAELFLR